MKTYAGEKIAHFTNKVRKYASLSGFELSLFLSLNSTLIPTFHTNFKYSLFFVERVLTYLE